MWGPVAARADRFRFWGFGASRARLFSTLWWPTSQPDPPTPSDPGQVACLALAADKDSQKDSRRSDAKNLWYPLEPQNDKNRSLDLKFEVLKFEIKASILVKICGSGRPPPFRLQSKIFQKCPKYKK